MGFIQEAAIFSSNVKLILVITIVALYFAGAFHIIDTGYIGVYKRGGALLNTWTEPGLHFMIPFITKVKINFKLVSLSSSNTANRSS
jgi:regulator of protease activity HflC (stomatin/prohibitin superfamily)